MSEESKPVEEFLELLRNTNGAELSKDNFHKLYVAVVRVLLVQDQWNYDDLIAQRDYFNLLSCAADPQLLANSLGHRRLFQSWVELSTNSFAIAYRLGAANCSRELIQANVKRAANGRRLIGATTREKVRLEAIKHRHKSKEQAAADMAEDVNLSIGHVKRLLSDLFPGDSWKTDKTTKH